MKKTIVSAVIMLFVLVSMAQDKPSKDSIRVVPQNMTFDLDRADQIKTSNSAIYQGKLHPVYATQKGKLYILLLSEKTGKEYRKYFDADKVIANTQR